MLSDMPLTPRWNDEAQKALRSAELKKLADDTRSEVAKRRLAAFFGASSNLDWPEMEELLKKLDGGKP
jgi:hypothetical protein